MKKSIELQLELVKKHLYISPLELCNLSCQICYTSKTKSRLSAASILDFVSRYAETTQLQSITFCGGEVFILPYFIDLINTLTPNYFVQIITNGSIDVLQKITQPNMVNLIVSLDGLPPYHDLNRGDGMWDKSTTFMKHAQQLGFHLEVFSIVTRENYPNIKEFETVLNHLFEDKIPVTYHPRKPMAYLEQHPLSNRLGMIEGFSFISSHDRIKLGKESTIFPPPDLGCYQLSVMSNGLVYGCCEGIRPLGRIDDDISSLLSGLDSRLSEWESISQSPSCLGCVEPGFMCGLKHI